MELGNMIFGNSRGEHPVDCDLQDEFCELLEGMGFDSYGNKIDYPEWAFENAVFRVQPYHWGDCSCGYEEREAEWSTVNAHRGGCYQQRKSELPLDYYRPMIDAALEERNRHNWGSDRGRSAQAEVDRLCDLEQKHQDDLLRGLCADLGIPWNDGCGSMVHCTCDYRDRWAEFCFQNGHASDCPIVTPNFLFKPSGFRLDWYKYPLRDSYSSEPLTRELMRAMFAACAESLRDISHPNPRDPA